MKNLLIDTNVILDICLEREPFVKDAQRVMRVISLHGINAYLTATTITDIYYITKRKTNHNQVMLFFEHLFRFVNILSVNETIVKSAMKVENKDFEIAKTIINLAHSLGLEVVAEGIETDQQVEIFKQLGCEFGQGYLFSPPLTQKEVMNFLNQNR